MVETAEVLTEDPVAPRSQTRITVKREIACRDLFVEISPLLETHFQEIARYKDIELDPDFVGYDLMEARGSLRVFTARLEDGRLIGYAIYFVSPNLHYRKSLQAVQDVLFIHPAHRGCGARLIRDADRELAKEGVQLVYHHVKCAHDFGPLLERMGYEQVEKIFARRLDRSES